ncbi:lytic transglycosylase domain-containing protein [Mesonia maritima]|uniref:Membrane-bound lytic murein transglycosylase D n=1 Tax=Mesonia maritima TaxID=1793873 RepID=A0ABU1K2G9_9FLAO|nr:LysM peptidoglycan-binding domain-containing protein [Mesonia maritima]MDR6299805.1 membrane-bound lytic murein transglycosylase D [Mesonia maritima]
MKKLFFLLLTLCSTFAGMAQKSLEQTQKKDSINKFLSEAKPDFKSINPAPKLVDDSLAIEFMDYQHAAKIDSLWKKELLNSDLYTKMQEALVNAALSDSVIKKEVSTDTLKARLQRMNAKTPFNIEYNSSLESVINYYLKRNRESMERLLALSYYYFPMFEQKLDQYDIPLEMKYLAIVESALNPRAKSRVGATGLWQFMFSTGKMHGLDVSSYVDERMDPVLATEAACKYLSNLYGMFNDWDLALASYNSGPGNVSKAIRRSGGNTDYWELRRYLPRETAGYVPAFIATMYIFEYADEHGFKPYKPEVTYYETDTIHIKQLLKFEQISKVTGVDEELISFLNPSYKLNIIPYLKDESYYVRLPLKATGLFVANEAEIYGYATKKLEEEKESLPRYVEADAKIRYRVRRGDYLGRIAERYGVGVSKIRHWNNLRSNNIRVGQYLTIYPRKPASQVSITSSEKSEKKPNEEYYVVRKGDSLWSISKKFPGITVQNIQKWNDISGNALKPGMKLKLSKS